MQLNEHTTESLTELHAEIMAQGFNDETAWDYAVLIGDTPRVDDEGNILVVKGGKVVARLKPLKSFGATDAPPQG